MMMAFVPAFAAVGLGQPDLAALDAVNGPDMNAVSSDHFHVLFYATLIHFSSLGGLALACRRLRVSVSQVRPGRSCSLLPSSSRSCLIHPFWFCPILEGVYQSVVASDLPPSGYPQSLGPNCACATAVGSGMPSPCARASL